MRGFMRVNNAVMDALCWTPLALIIRKARMRKMSKLAAENYDIRRINKLINQIMIVHGDMLS